MFINQSVKLVIRSYSVRKYWKLGSTAVRVLLRTVPRNIDVQPSKCMRNAKEQLNRTSRLAFCADCKGLNDCEVDAIVSETLKVSLLALSLWVKMDF